MTSTPNTDVKPYSPPSTFGTSLTQSDDAGHANKILSDPLQHKPKTDPTEPFTPNELTDLYDKMQKRETARKYDIDDRINVPPTHPEYVPSMEDNVVYDIKKQVSHQYTTMVVTATATVTLGLLAYMVSNIDTE